MEAVDLLLWRNKVKEVGNVRSGEDSSCPRAQGCFVMSGAVQGPTSGYVLKP